MAQKNHNLSSLYDVPFHVLDDLEIEDVIKVVGLYPIPFFSLKASHSIQKSEEISAIRNIWRGIHLLDHSHALTLNSKTKEMSDIHESFILTNNYWSILESKHPDPISTILFSLKKIGRADNSNNPPPRHEALPSSFDRILKTRLPHAIVSALTGIEDKVIKHLRHKLPFQPNVLAKTLVQKRVLTRHAFNRYALFIAVCVYEILLHNGQTPLVAFLNTVEAIEHSPTINANKSDDCHLPLNLYHCLVAHGHFPEINAEIHKVATPDFSRKISASFSIFAVEILSPSSGKWEFSLFPRH